MYEYFSAYMKCILNSSLCIRYLKVLCLYFAHQQKNMSSFQSTGFAQGRINMKNLMMSLLVTLTFSTAFGAYRGGELDMNCESIRGAQNAVPVKVQLRQLDKRGFVEGDQVPFELIVQTQGGQKVTTRYPGVAETEDVMVFFRTANQKVHVTFYLDEMDQNSLTLFGRDYLLKCEYLHQRW